MPEPAPTEPLTPTWSLQTYRIEYAKLQNAFRALVRQYECCEPIDEAFQCAQPKDHFEPCGSRSVRPIGWMILEVGEGRAYPGEEG